MGEEFRPQDLGSQPGNPRKGWIWALLGVSALVAVILMIMGREPPPPGDEVAGPPPAAIGRWTTTDRRYADRALTVTASTVSLGLGAGEPDDEGAITSVRAWVEGSVQVVRLEYSTVSGDQVLEMLLSGPDRMQLRNPSEVVWTRSR